MTELETLWQALEACTDKAERLARFKALKDFALEDNEEAQENS